MLHAQSLSNWRQKDLVIAQDTTRLDTLSIVPGSCTITLRDSVVAASRYVLDPYRGSLIWHRPFPQDTLRVRYRTMPLLLGGPHRHKDPERMIADQRDHVDPFHYVPPRGSDDLLGVSGLSKSGSISRGILFGNAQDLSVNSTLNLELSGKLTDRLNVLASVTDNNIPIQAGGNTQELQDFDQVFIKLYEEPAQPGGMRWDLVAGDFVMARPRSHFLNYYKKARGLSYGMGFGKVTHQEMGVSAAISKGKFARNTIQGVEGVQGPYRLRGDGGESFIIVLSGTEQVYVDGRLLTRGQENDYVIDYNTAELTFTANQLITKDRRISVEFQYSDKNYVRSVVQLRDELTLGRTRLRLNVYSEQDHKDQPLQQSLTETDQEALAQAGDAPFGAVVPGVDSVAFSADEVLYARIDSLGYFPVYLFSTDEDSAHFRISFTNVGSGNGDYVQDSFTANGRVFRWVAPDTINGVLVLRGDHAPVRALVAPRSQQMIAVGIDHRVSARTSFTGEVAVSGQDRNTFSSVDDGDNAGLGLHAGGTHAWPIGQRDTTWSIVVGADAEALSREFRVVERYRPVEFERNWNLPTGQAGALNTTLDNDQLLAGASAGVRGGKTGSAQLIFGTFQVRERYAGWKQGLQSDLHPGRWDIVGEASLLRTTEPSTTEFLRHKARLSRRMRWITVGYQDEQERNLFRSDSSDALETGSYQFYDWEAFVQSPDTFRNKWRLAAGQRYDQVLSQGALNPTTEATHYSALLDLARDPRNHLMTTFTFRQLSVRDSTLTAQEPEDTYLARVDYSLNAMKGVMLWNLFYEFSSGLEQRQTFIYVQVPAGQGLYVWIDYNADGVKDLNEFELANFSYEADYIRVYVPSNEFVRTFRNQFSTSLDLRPGVAWSTSNGMKKFIGKFSDLASFRTDRKTGSDDLAQAMNPLLIDPTDTGLTAISSSIRNTVYYDRSSRTWSLDHTYQNDRGKSLLLNGFESRVREFNTLHLRWNTTPQWTLELQGETGRVAANSDVIEGRTYAIDQASTEPRLTWQPTTSFRASASFSFTTKDNRQDLGGEHAELQDLGMELRYNAVSKGIVQAAVDLVRIGYDGTVDSSLGNEMLGGLKPGDNFTWSVGLQRNLSDHLQVDLTYNGRQSEGTPAIHVGGAQVRAFF